MHSSNNQLLSVCYVLGTVLMLTGEGRQRFQRKILNVWSLRCGGGERQTNTQYIWYQSGRSLEKNTSRNGKTKWERVLCHLSGQGKAPLEGHIPAEGNKLPGTWEGLTTCLVGVCVAANEPHRENLLCGNSKVTNSVFKRRINSLLSFN